MWRNLIKFIVAIIVALVFDELVELHLPVTREIGWPALGSALACGIGSLATLEFLSLRAFGSSFVAHAGPQRPTDWFFLGDLLSEVLFEDAYTDRFAPILENGRAALRRARLRPHPLLRWSRIAVVLVSTHCRLMVESTVQAFRVLEPVVDLLTRLRSGRAGENQARAPDRNNADGDAAGQAVSSGCEEREPEGAVSEED